MSDMVQGEAVKQPTYVRSPDTAWVVVKANNGYVAPEERMHRVKGAALSHGLTLIAGDTVLGEWRGYVGCAKDAEGQTHGTLAECLMAWFAASSEHAMDYRRPPFEAGTLLWYRLVEDGI